MPVFKTGPLDAPHLIGRDSLLQNVRKHLAENVLIVSRRGADGVGTTALARRLAANAQRDYPDGFVEVDLRGSGAQYLVRPDLAQVQRRVLLTLAPETSPAEEARVLRKQYLATLSKRRAILLLDDAAAFAQVRGLLPQRGSIAIVTSRLDLGSGLPRLFRVSLGKLSIKDVYDLVTSTTAVAPQLPRRWLRRFSALLDGNPLALRIAAPLLGASYTLSLRDLVRQLGDAEQRILALRGTRTPDIAVDIALETSYVHLPVALRRAFETLAVFPAPFSESSAAAIWDVPALDARKSLGQLARLALVDYHATAALYEMHRHARDFAHGLLLGQGERCRDLVTRYVGHYLRVAIQLSASLVSATSQGQLGHLTPYDLWEHIPVAWHRLNGRDPGWPQPSGMDAWICELPLHGRPLLDLVLSQRDYLVWLTQALAAAETFPDRLPACALLGALGQTQAALGDHEHALLYLERQASLANSIQAGAFEAEAWMYAGASYRASGMRQKAKDSWDRALALWAQLGDPRVAQIRSWLEQLRGTDQRP